MEKKTLGQRGALKKTTPAMQQYFDMKEKYPDCIILFRMGDFFETFFEDAKVVARELEITLTTRGKLMGGGKIPLAGIPYHALDKYLPELVKKGYKVAICEQLEDPKKAKGIVKRGVIRVVTKGTITDQNMLDDRSNNFIVSAYLESGGFGIAACDISTGEFLTTFVDNKLKLLDELSRIRPGEIILPLSLENSKIHVKLKEQSYYINTLDDRFYYSKKAERTLKETFGVANLDGFGLSQNDVSHLAISASGALLSYLEKTQMTELSHIKTPKRYSRDNFVVLDRSAINSLEITHSMTGSTKGTLLWAIDQTRTSMGARLLKRWMLQPLLDVKKITSRLDATEEFYNNTLKRNEIVSLLGKVSDIERIVSKISFKTANARDLTHLFNGLVTVPELKEQLVSSNSSYLRELSRIPDLNKVTDIIERTIKDDAPLSIREGGIIEDGYDKDVDELRDILANGKQYIANIESTQRESTGIKSLKIKYNKVLGYFIEVSKANKHLVPEDFILKQGQVNSERYVTEELKGYESKILSAQERIKALEYDIFMAVIDELTKEIKKLLDTASRISKIDVICSFANVSVNNDYKRPQVHDNYKISIKNGRHPVLEMIEPQFIPNDTTFDSKSVIKIITGPNMAGKSTYMRQTALIVLMAQIGCFVPAQSADIGVVDKIFTRVGAQDNLFLGKSTFMVEMNETSYILNNATSRSLIVLDEIGRGTSTFDGVSIAWSVAEYIIKKIKAKTLFATHYHVLTKLAKDFDGIRNFQITVKEHKDKIVFLRKIVEGGTNKSYGIQVAKLAGMPDEVVKRSKEIMASLEEQDTMKRKLSKQKGMRTPGQLSLHDI